MHSAPPRGGVHALFLPPLPAGSGADGGRRSGVKRSLAPRKNATPPPKCAKSDPEKATDPHCGPLKSPRVEEGNSAVPAVKRRFCPLLPSPPMPAAGGSVPLPQGARFRCRRGLGSAAAGARFRCRKGVRFRLGKTYTSGGRNRQTARKARKTKKRELRCILLPYINII